MRRIRTSALFILGPVLASAQSDPNQLAASAVQLQQAGSYEAAAKTYSELLKVVPNDVATHVNFGVVLVHLGRFDEAIAQYRAADHLLPGDPRIGLNLALAYGKSGQSEQARKMLESLHASSPENVQITMLLSDQLLQAGENERVVQLLRPLQSSEDLGIAYMLGMALLRTQHIDEAQMQLNRILKNGDTAESRYLLGTRMFESGDFPSAAKQLGSAVELNPKLPGLQSLYGRALLNTGDPDAASKAFDAALATNPGDFSAQLGIGEILAVRHNYADAQSHLEKALQLRPTSQPAQLALAECLQGAGAPAKALPYAKAAEALPDSHRVLAQIYSDLHRTQEASRESETARKIAAENDPGPEVGTMAPRFTLVEASANKTVSLSDFKGKPLALIFGSYSCPNFRASANALKALGQKYGNQAPFLLVYIREAHATDNWQSTRNERESIQLAPATNMAEKQEHAAMCSRTLHLPFHAVVDDMQGSAEASYRAWPSRAYLIDKRGRIAYSTRLDELSFQPTEMEAKLRTLIR